MNAHGWNYLVPRLHSSAWDVPDGVFSTADLEYPRVSIFCPYDERPWLIGSFEWDAELTKHTGADYWSWYLNYPTGDGFMIHLNRQGTGPSNLQFLAGNVVRQQDAEAARLQEAIDSGDIPGAIKISQSMEKADAATRSRLPLQCKTCDLRRVYRVENLHPVVRLFWNAGRREVPLGTFLKGVDRVA